MKPHRLDPLLRPRSVAVVGASGRANSMGEWSLRNLERGGFPGIIYAVNPGYTEVRGYPCFASISDLPETPDLVIFAIGDQRLEASLDEAIEKGIPAAVIQSSLCIDDDNAPFLKERVRQKVNDAGMLVCGGNGMGFYNVSGQTWGCGFDSRKHPPEGNASLISHSGSGMSGIIDCEARLRINFAVSTGNELSVTMDEYLDFVLDLPETKVVGLFVETARNPAGLRAALQKAVTKEIPVVALKVGRTRKSAELAVSHSGAMAGDDATYAALFDRYGVHRVADMDEMATAMILFAELNPIGPGGLVTLHDSGGERQLLVDLASDAGVPLTELSEKSVRKLEAVLDPELPAVNPLDGWSRGGENWAENMTNCFTIMAADEGAAIAALIHDRAPDGVIYSAYVGYMNGASQATGKPMALVGSRQGTGADQQVLETTWRGMPVLDGVVPFLKGVRGLMNYRDFLATPPMNVAAAPKDVVQKWARQLSKHDRPDEAMALRMLGDFGIPANESISAASEEEVISAAAKIGYPVVLKTAMAGIAHKSDVGGVILNISDEGALAETWRDLQGRLGPDVVVAAMVPAGIEMILGARQDPQFGPLIVIGMGGLLAETMRDVQFALPPFDAAYARRLVARLKFRDVLDGVRGAPAANIEEFCEVAARFSRMVDALSGHLSEIDLNPVIVTSDRCIAVDAFAIGKQKEE